MKGCVRIFRVFWKIFWGCYFREKQFFHHISPGILERFTDLIQYGISCALTILGLSATNSFSWLGHRLEQLFWIHYDFRTRFLNPQNLKSHKFIDFETSSSFMVVKDSSKVERQEEEAWRCFFSFLEFSHSWSFSPNYARKENGDVEYN